MVQRKVPSKIGIKPHLLKLDTQLVNLKPSSSSSSSSQTHEKMKKIIKKSRSIKRSDESPSLAPFRKKKPPATPPKQSPNYMKSTSSFEARKEQSPAKTPSPKISRTHESASGIKGSRSSSLKMVRTLTKTPSFKPLRSSKKVILCEDLDAHKATCSSTLKESKFPSYLQLNHGGSELDGTSAMKVCPYSYCSLNGHQHASVPPLKSFLSARRRALKTQKGFKLGCLSPRQIKPNVKKSDVKEVDIEEVNRDLFIDFIGDQELECSDIDWEEGFCSDSANDGLKLQRIDADVDDDPIGKLYDEHQELYDEESVSSGVWSDEYGDSASNSSIEQMKIDQDYLNYEVPSTSTTVKSDVNDKIEDPNLEIHNQKEESSHESKAVPDFAEKIKDETDKNHTTVIYNIIQFNVSVFINGGKTEHSETDETVTVKEPATSVAADKIETEEVMSNKNDEGNQIVADKDIGSTDQFNLDEKQGNPEQEHKEFEEPATGSDVDQTHGIGEITSETVVEMDSFCKRIGPNDDLPDPCINLEKQGNPEQEHKEFEEPATGSNVDQTRGIDEITSETGVKTDSFCKKIGSYDDLQDPCVNLRNLTRIKKSGEKIGDDLREFNPRGPNFLPETRDPDAETVDLRHQMMDERKNAEEWMVDFALQQAVTTLAPARKRKVALLVEAFEKVMPSPVPVYETHNRHISKAFTNSRPMQACS